jgi:chromosome segregation ATPase
VKATTLEARMLNDKVKRLQVEKQEMESQVQAFSRECELLFKKASALEAERVQLRKLVNEQGHMLEAKEQECIKLTTALANFQDNLDIEVRYSADFALRCMQSTWHRSM